MKKDEDEFIKKITEIIDSIKKGECTVPINEVPEGKGEGHKNGVTDAHPKEEGDGPIQRSRTGSAKMTREESVVENRDSSKDSKPIEFVVGGVKSDKKDVATSMSPMTSLESSRLKRKFEVTDVPLWGKTPVVSQSSSDSVSTT